MTSNHRDHASRRRRAASGDYHARVVGRRSSRPELRSADHARRRRHVRGPNVSIDGFVAQWFCQTGAVEFFDPQGALVRKLQLIGHPRPTSRAA